MAGKQRWSATKFSRPAYIEANSIPEPNTGCWLWLGALNTRGYGRMRMQRVHVGAHKVSWVAHHGPILNGLYVLHRCDVRACVNPAHLFLGTHLENMADRRAKGRNALCAVRGERNGVAKLTPEKVREIRRRYAPGATVDLLAAEFGVTRECIYHVYRRWSWAHVEDA